MSNSGAVTLGDIAGKVPMLDVACSREIRSYLGYASGFLFTMRRLHGPTRSSIGNGFLSRRCRRAAPAASPNNDQGLGLACQSTIREVDPVAVGEPPVSNNQGIGSIVD